MMEESHTGKRHCHTVLVTSLDYEIVTDRAAGLCDIRNAGLLCSVDIIGEREECVRSAGYILHAI